MATWHQSKNTAGLRGLWTPHPTEWKVIDDKPGQFAGSISFGDEAAARNYADKRGGIVLPPMKNPPAWPQVQA